MRKKIKLFPKKHPLLLSLSLGVLGNLVWTLIQSKLNQVNFFEAFWQIPKWIVDFVANILTTNVPIWGVLMVIIAGVFIIWGYIKITNKPQKIEPFQLYTSDFYKGQKYKWEWWDNTLTELRPICNECDGELAFDSPYGYWLTCPNCDKQYKKPDAAMQNLASTYFVNKANKKSKKT